jgi:hypothetical protein
MELCEFIALVRYENEEAARANSDSAEQSAWWEETSQYLEDPVSRSHAGRPDQRLRLEGRRLHAGDPGSTEG